MATLASKMCILVKDWDRRKKYENRKTDLDSLEKIKVKLNKIRKSKERLAKKQLYHFPGIKNIVNYHKIPIIN